MTDDRFAVPVGVNLRTMLIGAGVLVVAAAVPPEAGGPMAGETGLLFQFGVPGAPGGHVRVFVPAVAVPPTLVEMVTEAAGDVTDEAVMERVAALTREANLAAGLLPGGDPVHCIGCGARLFGTVATRGVCLACSPDDGETP